MRLLLHAGTPKTGTTALQHYLKEPGVAGDALHYVKCGRDYDGRDFGRQVGLNLSTQPEEGPSYSVMHLAGLNTAEERRQHSETFFSALETEVAETSGDPLFVMSDEELHTFLTEDMAKKIGDRLGAIFGQIQVLVYIRNPVKYLSSAYAQSVRMGNRSDAGEFFDFMLEDTLYLKSLRLWAEVFGKQNLSVRWYKGDDIVPDFLEAIGLEPKGYAGQLIHPSMSHIGVEVLLRMNRIVDPYYFPLMRDFCENKFPGKSWLAPPELAKTIVVSTFQELEDLSEEFSVSGLTKAELKQGWRLVPASDFAELDLAKIDEITDNLFSVLENNLPPKDPDFHPVKHLWMR